MKFIKPKTAKSVPVDDLADQFSDYYKQHPYTRVIKKEGNLAAPYSELVGWKN